MHGQPVTFCEAGADSGGPVLVLLHGLASSSQTWAPVLPLLGRVAHVIAPDLLGHGQSAKPRRGDYSLGACAAGLRDLLVALDLDRATIVGHSFGGGGKRCSSATSSPNSPSASCRWPAAGWAPRDHRKSTQPTMIAWWPPSVPGHHAARSI